MLVSLLTGCSSPSAPAPTQAQPRAAADPSAPTVTLPALDPALSAAGRSACVTFLDALPDTLAQLPRVDAQPAVGELEAAWGEPAIRLRCGVSAPVGFDPRAVPDSDPNAPSPCVKVSGVGWYVDPDQVDGGTDAVLSAVTFSPRIAVLVPYTYLPAGSAAALAELAAPVRGLLRRSLRCA